MGIVDARIHDGDHNTRISTGNPPRRRRRHCGRPPLCDISIVGAGVGRAVVNIVRDEGLDRLHGGVELRELNVRPIAQMAEHSEP